MGPRGHRPMYSVSYREWRQEIIFLDILQGSVVLSCRSYSTSYEHIFFCRSIVCICNKVEQILPFTWIMNSWNLCLSCRCGIHVSLVIKINVIFRVYSTSLNSAPILSAGKRGKFQMNRFWLIIIIECLSRISSTEYVDRSKSAPHMRTCQKQASQTGISNYIPE